MKILIVDFETYYSRDYTLSKLTTEEYIRHPNFEVVGVAVKEVETHGKGTIMHANAPAKWCSGDDMSVWNFLKRFDWENTIAVAHNAMFDMAILSWKYQIHPKKIADTLSMARALHGTEVGGSLAKLAKHYNLGEKGTEVINAFGKRRSDFSDTELTAYAGYCINDVELTYKLFVKLFKKLPKEELDLIDLTMRMFTEPQLELDVSGLELALESLRNDKLALLANMPAGRDDLMSNDKFAHMLTSYYNVKPPTKISPTTGKETYAFAKTDPGFKELLEHFNPQVQALAAARVGIKSTIVETRTKRFIEIGKRGKLPIPLKYYAAHTGRWGGTDKVNFQNLPRNSFLKQCIYAPAKHYLIDCDSSQIEARMLAWLAEQDDLVDAFDNGEDVYRIMAGSIYGKDPARVSPEERFVGKQTILGSGYGMGAEKFRTQLGSLGAGLAAAECKRIIDVYRATYRLIPSLWRQAHDALFAMMRDEEFEFGRGGVLKVDGENGIRLPNGLYIKYPNLRKTVDEDTGKRELVYDSMQGRRVVPVRIYGGKVVENVCQALARLVIGKQMLMVNKKYPVVMTVHDSVVCVVPDEDVPKTAIEYVKLCMRLRPEWAPDLPLDCEASYGNSYGLQKEFPED